MSIAVRLHKYLATCGVASRRKSEEIIGSGRVSVNGEVVTIMGTLVCPGDVVTVDGSPVIPQERVYIVLHKPPGVLCTRKDQDDRPTIYDIIDNPTHSLFSVGRLDFNSSGLLLLTNDGDFCNRIIHPSNSIIKEYCVVSVESAPDRLIKDFLQGVTIEDVTYKATGIRRCSGRQNSLMIMLHEGKKREIRVVYKKYSVTIRALCRTALGGLRLDECNLPEGKFRYYQKNVLEEAIYGTDNNNSN